MGFFFFRFRRRAWKIFFIGKYPPLKIFLTRNWSFSCFRGVSSRMTNMWGLEALIDHRLRCILYKRIVYGFSHTRACQPTQPLFNNVLSFERTRPTAGEHLRRAMCVHLLRCPLSGEARPLSGALLRSAVRCGHGAPVHGNAATRLDTCSTRLRTPTQHFPIGHGCRYAGKYCSKPRGKK